MEGCNRDEAWAKADWHISLLGTIFDARVGSGAGALVEVEREDDGHIVRCVMVLEKGRCDLRLCSAKDVMDMLMWFYTSTLRLLVLRFQERNGQPTFRSSLACILTTIDTTLNRIIHLTAHLIFLHVSTGHAISTSF